MDFSFLKRSPLVSQRAENKSYEQTDTEPLGRCPKCAIIFPLDFFCLDYLENKELERKRLGKKDHNHDLHTPSYPEKRCDLEYSDFKFRSRKKDFDHDLQIPSVPEKDHFGHNDSFPDLRMRSVPEKKRDLEYSHLEYNKHNNQAKENRLCKDDMNVIWSRSGHHHRDHHHQSGHPDRNKPYGVSQNKHKLEIENSYVRSDLPTKRSRFSSDESFYPHKHDQQVFIPSKGSPENDVCTYCQKATTDNRDVIWRNKQLYHVKCYMQKLDQFYKNSTQREGAVNRIKHKPYQDEGLNQARRVIERPWQDLENRLAELERKTGKVLPSATKEDLIKRGYYR